MAAADGIVESGLIPPERLTEVAGTPLFFDSALDESIEEMAGRVTELRSSGELSPQVLRHLGRFFRLKNIYHSNAIEGNLLTLGETRLVVEQGLTITGKPLKDSMEAKNLSHALDFFEELATGNDPLTAVEIRSIHSAILKGIDDENAGAYREVNVEITGSAFPPPSVENVRPQMDEFCAWFATASTVSATSTDDVSSPIVVAAAAHAWFAQIHPFIDGNGRTARILMNLILMRHGYPIAVITRDERQRYYDSLEASQSGNLTPLVALIHESVAESLEEYESAAATHEADQEWAESLVAKFTQPERTKAENQYAIWKHAMELFRSYMRQTANTLDQQAIETGGLGRVFFEDFEMIDFEKYLTLRRGQSAKRTWFFRTDFRKGSNTSRLLFFFGYPSQELGKELTTPDRVTLHVAVETTPFYYVRLESANAPGYPDLCEAGYDSPQEKFVGRHLGGGVTRSTVESIGHTFFDQAMTRSP